MKSMKAIAFTFDDGPIEYKDNSSAMRILHTLKAYGQRATFFYVGENINEENKSAIEFAARIGCEVGNHGYSHRSFTELTKEEIKEELDKTEKLLNDIVGKRKTLVRLPYLLYNEDVISAVTAPIISCNIDTRDWDKASVEEIIEAVMRAEEAGELDGGIVLMHEPYETTASALQYLIPELLRKGYQLVTVSELAAIKNITLKEHDIYMSF